MIERQRFPGIHIVASAFRAEVGASRHLLPNLLEAFPTGACGTTSEMLSLYLLEAFGIASSLVYAERHAPRFMSHTWITVGDAVVDLTVDQFADYDGASPYIGPMNAWHAAWTVATHRSVQRAGLHPGLAPWGAAYATITERVNERIEPGAAS